MKKGNYRAHSALNIRIIRSLLAISEYALETKCVLLKKAGGHYGNGLYLLLGTCYNGSNDFPL